MTESFMAPYNAKVWAHPATEMNSIWVGERVATIKFEDILSNVIKKRDAPAWGPNAQFRYPMNGTGSIWLKIFEALPNANKRLNARVTRIRTKPGAKRLELADGSKVPFDGLLSTMPIVSMLRMLPDHPNLADLAAGDNGAADHSRFKHQTCNVIGVGIEGTGVPEFLNGVHWVYFPEDEYIFYRVTVLSNFSPVMVALPYKQWSLLIEVSESKYRVIPSSREELRQKVLEGLRKAGMLPPDAKIVTIWDKRLEYGYPIPYVERNMHVHAADAALRELGVWSRGRFGSWKYEVGNQDHSCMLGVDAVDSMLFGGNDAGREVTFNAPNTVNQQYRKYDFDFDPSRLAKQAGRSHSFGAAPRRLLRLPQWDWVTYHCQQDDHWADRVRELMVSRPEQTKWLMHSYEACGAADTKRPMLEMLREGLDHLDRVPSSNTSHEAVGWARHVSAHYQKLPERIVFVRGGLPADSALLSKGSGVDKFANSDFHMWGSHVAELPLSLRSDFCQIAWPLVQRVRRHSRSCPERVLTMSNSAMFVSKRRLLAAPIDVWQSLLALLSDRAAATNGQVIDFAWHLLFGQPAVLPGRAMTSY
uniref:Amine oxidase domain-containing protein n=1 Tax=Coccolithus braarudii TaxID=221442 RepID=A0A7S0L1S9_9EUKA